MSWIDRAKKATLVAWCESRELSSEGTVKDLRERIIAFQEATPELADEPEEDEVIDALVENDVAEAVEEVLEDDENESLGNCENCGTDFDRFAPFPDPDSELPRCPNCGRSL